MSSPESPQSKHGRRRVVPHSGGHAPARAASRSALLVRRIARVTGVLVVPYVIVVVLMMAFEERLVFLPSPFEEGISIHPGVAYEDAWFTAVDGVELHGWYAPHERPRAVVLFAHGNAGNITHRAPLLRRLHAMSTSVLMFDYRGYGKSAGSPDEPGILRDARAARSWLAKRAGVAESEIVLMGESLGGAVMVDLAQDGAAGLVLENTFTSLPDVAAHHYPWLPVRWLMRTRLDSLAKISRYDGPLLQSHADQDEVIPFALGRQLFERSPSRRKQFIPLTGQQHNDPRTETYFQALDAFFDQISGIGEPGTGGAAGGP